MQLRLSRVNSHVEITVSDTGRGIAPEFLPFVFERFRQADASFSREHGGLGLGLAIAKQLAELHGGTITASSDGLGSGRDVHGEAAADDRASADADRNRSGSIPQTDRAAAELEPMPRLDGVRVLAVDDEPDSLELAADGAGRGGRDGDDRSHGSGGAGRDSVASPATS